MNRASLETSRARAMLWIIDGPIKREPTDAVREWAEVVGEIGDQMGVCRES
jgi:hypothetical protein